jgi:hypothetical protein
MASIQRPKGSMMWGIDGVWPRIRIGDPGVVVEMLRIHPDARELILIRNTKLFAKRKIK